MHYIIIRLTEMNNERVRTLNYPSRGNSTLHTKQFAHNGMTPVNTEFIKSNSRRNNSFNQRLILLSLLNLIKTHQFILLNDKQHQQQQQQHQPQQHKHNDIITSLKAVFKALCVTKEELRDEKETLLQKVKLYIINIYIAS